MFLYTNLLFCNGGSVINSIMLELDTRIFIFLFLVIMFYKIENTYLKIKRFFPHVYHRIKTGVSYKDTWSLDYHIDSVIYEGLKKFKKVNNCHPCELTMEQWDTIIDKMIEGYGLLIQEKEFPIKKENMKGLEHLFYTEKETRKIKEAENLFKKYKRGLWR